MYPGPGEWASGGRTGSAPRRGNTATAQPADQPGESLTARRFLLNLHLAHGYPSSPGVRSAWAVFVDFMAFTLVFWGFSGLLM
jgi:hypothetical protein